jgi:ribonuclease HI
MRFKGESVWVRADDSGRPVLDAAGRAEMKYRESDAKSYRPLPVNLIPDPGGGPPEPPRAPRRPRPDGVTKRAPATGGPAVEIWTDGACSGNPGPMGIGVVVIDDGKRREKGEYLGVGTNNIAELMAIVRALEEVPRDRTIVLHADSSYALGLLGKGWKAKANQEIVERMRKLGREFHDLRLVKVDGHAGVAENERADELARTAIVKRT